MHCVEKIKEGVYYIGSSDTRIPLFENLYPLPDGISYNSYLIRGEKNVLLDTVDKSVSRQFLENLEFALNGDKLDYLIINHMEPDHCAVAEDLVLRHPDMKIAGSAKTLMMLGQFFNFDVESRYIQIPDGGTLDTGSHCFKLIAAPMVHWPEVTVTYEVNSKLLFSADAFGTFGTLDGCIFADSRDFEKDILPEARRYYTNIVGKYGMQVQSLAKKIAQLDIAGICPLHGPIWRRDFNLILEKYDLWSRYMPEDNAVMIACASIYGNTMNAARILASFLAENGVRDVRIYDTSAVHPSYLISEAFRCSCLVFASSTYNGGIFTTMETLLADLKAHNLQNRTAALIENGSWAPAAGRKMREILEGMKNISLPCETINIKSAVKTAQHTQLEQMAKQLAETMAHPAQG